ncbi:MAG TPA: CDP-alcohol phosphatidyltransferase family protein [bacterium (Candidatus Stahlbacteria)]|nr:CDP-alcohol phosphatidyltransferase family protein [Candidatus Stahlbacteria bacterium]
MVTIPNLISTLRLFLIPPLVIAIIGNEVRLALILLFISYISDIIDGILARNLNQESDFGKVIDPLSDKLTLISVLVTLTMVKRFPFWALVILALREILIISAGFYLLSSGRRVIPASLPGKITGWIFGIMLIVYIIEFRPLLKLSIYAAILSMVFSSFTYCQEFLDEVKKRSPARSPHRP